MDAATENRSASALLPALLAGLEAGMAGALWMLAWMGVSAVWQQRSFWTPENLMSTAFDRNATLPAGFATATCTGMALYLAMYSLLGALFAVAVRGRVPRRRVMLLSVAFALAWYYFSFRWTFQYALPLVALLHVERSTVLGHLVYGTALGRYPVYLQRLTGTQDVAGKAAAVTEAEAAPDAPSLAPVESSSAAEAAESVEPAQDGPPAGS